jgi:hydrogenase-1 operon protein HyaF
MSEAATPVSGEVKFNIQVSDELTQNVKPLLHEIKHALENLIENGESSIIDLRSIPLAPGEEDRILDTLGKGEVQAQLETLGLSEIIETQYAGVWVVTHFNDDGNVISRFIEVTTMPGILSSQTEDIKVAYNSLTVDLDENQ